MKIGFRALAALVLLVVLGGAAMLLFQRQIGQALFERAVERQGGRNNLAALPDGLHIGLCGTGSPLPSRSRAGPCTVVIAGKAMFVVDAGEGGARNITLMGLPNSDIRALFITHFHSDHIDGMGPMMMLRWVASANTSPLPVYGPAGIETVMAGFNAAYAADNGYRTAHHGEAIAPSAAAGGIAKPFAVPTGPVVVYAADGVKVTAFPVDHGPIHPAVGYRFDYKGRSVVFSGDTIPQPSVLAASKGADLLVHEALQPKLLGVLSRRLDAAGRAKTAQITRDILNYHTTPEQAADIAQKAGVRMLLLDHIVPGTPSSFFDKAFLGDAKRHFDGPIHVGEDGEYYSLPAGSNEIGRGSWF